MSMMMAANRTSETQDTWAALYVYEQVLCWPLLVGTTFMSSRDAVNALAKESRPTLSTTCSGVDAVAVPRVVLRAIVSRLQDQKMPSVPCLNVSRDQAVLLVRAGTGSVFAGLKDVRVESGAGGRLILPPSHGLRWDIPPWDDSTEAPCPLLDGSELIGTVHDALRLVGNLPP
ncbi:hypothetical protein [Streptomyces sp. NPDC015350]|uniref:hypothetical protein n=1 Tax=Streptomyces sp. NPDC015350 TaxID=3364955 RepID=UPI003702364B